MPGKSDRMVIDYLSGVVGCERLNPQSRFAGDIFFSKKNRHGVIKRVRYTQRSFYKLTLMSSSAFLVFIEYRLEIKSKMQSRFTEDEFRPFIV